MRGRATTSAIGHVSGVLVTGVSHSNVVPFGHRLFSSFSNPAFMTRAEKAGSIFKKGFGKALNSEKGTVVVGFDGDGTTLNTKEPHTISYVETHTIHHGEEPELGEDPINEAMRRVNGDPDKLFPQYFGEEKGREAFITFTRKMEIYYPATATLMPHFLDFLNATTILSKYGLMERCIISYAKQSYLEKAVENLGIRHYFKVVAGTENQGADKTSEAMITKRILPGLFGYRPDLNEILAGSTLIHIDDSRTTGPATVKSALPYLEAHYIAYNKGEPGKPMEEVLQETPIPHCMNWEKFREKLIEAACKAVEENRGRSRLSPEDEDALLKDLELSWVKKEQERRKEKRNEGMDSNRIGS